MLCALLLASLAVHPLTPTRPTYGEPAWQELAPEAPPTLQQQAEALRREGKSLWDGGELQAAHDRYQQALLLYRQAGDRIGEGLTLVSLAGIYRAQAQPQRAIEYFQATLVIWQELGGHPEDEKDLFDLIGLTYYGQGAYEPALAAFAQALAIACALGDPLEAAITLGNVGVVYQSLGDRRAALETLQQALVHARQAGNRAIEGRTLNEIALVELGLSNYEAALRSAEQALAIAREVDDRVGESWDLTNIGAVYQAQGDYAAALAAFQQVLGMAQALGDRAGEGRTLSNLGSVYEGQSDFGAALEAYQQALAIARELGDRTGEGTRLNNIGLVYSEQGDYRPAIASLQEALAVARDIANRPVVATTLGNIGLVHAGQGQYGPALAAFQQALALAREVGDRAGESRALVSIGEMYRAVAQYPQALENLQQALALTRAGGTRTEEMGALNGLGLTYRDQGDNRTALAYHEEALAVAREVGNRRAAGRILGNVGLTAHDRGAHEVARSAFEEALALAREIGDRAAEGIALTNLGEAYRGQGDAATALEILQRALALHREIGDRAAESLTLRSLGALYHAQGADNAALAAFREAIDAREDVRNAARLEEFKTSLAGGDADLYRAAVLLQWRLQQPAEAFDLAERGRARTFLDQLGNIRLDLARAADPALVQQERALRTQISALDEQLRRERARPPTQQRAEQLDAWSAQLAARQRAYEDVLTQLKLSDPATASLVSVVPLTLPEVQAQLAPDTTLLSYFVIGDRTLAFVVRRAELHVFELPVGEAQLREQIAELRHFAAADHAAPALEQLAQWLLAPLANQLTTPIVGIIPHGVLHYLPFAALPVETGYFGDAHALYLLPSASTLPFVQRGRTGSAERLLAVAESAPPGLPPLRFADLEASVIARLYDAQPLLDGAATKTAIEQLAPAARIVHVAAHGELNATRPLFSRIFLAPDAQSDGSLTVQDVYGLNLANTDLVVLSACETQLGAQSRGDDVVGLNRAFIYAGAPSVIASLWSVNDQATAVFMASFYQHLHGGTSKAEALQQAQAETRAQYPHPYYWAAFVLTGDPGRNDGR